LVFHSSTITMMHGPINIRFTVHHQESYHCICRNTYFVILVMLTVS